MAEKTPLSPIPEIDEEAFAIAEANDIEKDRKFTVMMGGEELLATTIYINNVNKAIKKRIEQYNSEIGAGKLTSEMANTKLERFVNALHRGLVLFEDRYQASVSLISEDGDFSSYVRLPELDLPPKMKEFLDKFVSVTKKQLKNYIIQPISIEEKKLRASGLQQQILELANAMLKSTGRVLSINEGIIGGKKSRQKRRIKRTRKN